MGFSVRHVVNTDVETFWRLTFDERVARALIRQLGDAGDFEVAEDRVDSDGVRHRRIEVWANVQLPGLVKKLVGDGSYTEVGRWDPRALRYSAVCTPKSNADKYGTRYEIISHPRPDGTCEREIITENTVNVPAVRRMILNRLEQGQRASHDASAAFLNDWIQTRAT